MYSIGVLLLLLLGLFSAEGCALSVSVVEGCAPSLSVAGSLLPVLLSVFVAKHDLKFMILLPPAPGCSNYRRALFLCRAGD